MHFIMCRYSYNEALQGYQEPEKNQEEACRDGSCRIDAEKGVVSECALEMVVDNGDRISRFEQLHLDDVVVGISSSLRSLEVASFSSLVSESDRQASIIARSPLVIVDDNVEFQG